MAEDREEKALEEIVNRGPVGTFAVAGLATAIVVVIYLVFYFWVFVPRGVTQ